MSDRVPLPRDLADRVLFESDRQCCICRAGEARGTIHHIDGDPSNNAFENLALLCLDHHSQAHSSEAFVRNLTPGLIAQYNTTWRTLVLLRLNPQADPEGLREYHSEVFLEFDLACHGWKSQYFMLQSTAFRNRTAPPDEDVWDMIRAAMPTRYSSQEWESHKLLFSEGLDRLLAALDRLSTIHADAIPPTYKTQLIRARRQLGMIQWVYAYIPRVHPELVDPNDSGFHSMFARQFADAVTVIGGIAREAARLQGLAESAS